MRKTIVPGLFLSLFWPLLLASMMSHAEPKQALITGFAYERDSDQLIYTENHRVMVDGASLTAHQVVYQTPDGTTLASKTLDYGNHGFAPTFEMTDARDGYV
ncbi:MAG: hypothetical protein ACPHER_11080, partial [Nevskiales bacterium]